MIPIAREGMSPQKAQETRRLRITPNAPATTTPRKVETRELLRLRQHRALSLRHDSFWTIRDRLGHFQSVD